MSVRVDDIARWIRNEHSMDRDFLLRINKLESERKKVFYEEKNALIDDITNEVLQSLDKKKICNKDCVGCIAVANKIRYHFYKELKIRIEWISN